MDVNRALQILDASNQIDVVFEGESVWIDGVNPSTEIATIHSLSKGHRMEVKVDRLHEPQ